MRGRSSWLAAVAAIAFAVSGCGGGSGGGKKQYAARLDAMCADFAARERKIGAPRDANALAERGARIVQAYEQAIEQPIQSLEAPKGIETEAARLRTLARQQGNLLRALVASARSGDLARIRRLAPQVASLNARAGAIAEKLGAHSCAA